MKTFNVRCSWSVSGTLKIEAETETEAIDKALRDGRTVDVEDAEYVDHTWMVDDVEEE